MAPGGGGGDGGGGGGGGGVDGGGGGGGGVMFNKSVFTTDWCCTPVYTNLYRHFYGFYSTKELTPTTFNPRNNQTTQIWK